MNALEIKKIRKNMGMSQTEFGDMLGVGIRSVQLWESGNRNISESAKKLLIATLDDEQYSDSGNDVESLKNEVNMLKEKINGLKENFKLLYDQLLYLQNSFLVMQKGKDNNQKKSG